MPTIYTNVEVDLADLNTDDMIAEIEERGYTVLGKDDVPEYEEHIHTLKEDFLNWYQFGMTNENFEKSMKEFFKETIGEYIV